MTYEIEFPNLKKCGLYAADIRGDGNCLFNSLSDQMYGTQAYHDQLRARVVEHISDNEAYYANFLEVYPGGGTRRNPKRKTAGASSTDGPTPAEQKRVFQEHLQRMARGGTWGDNMEIQAFAAAFDYSVKIYQANVEYIVPAPTGHVSERTLHIAYHTWEHYSSIRNTAGPHQGPPHVNPINPVDGSQHMERLTQPFIVPKSQVKELMAACPDAEKSTILAALQKTRGNVNTAYELLAGVDGQSNSSQNSSSLEREDESDDDIVIRGPKRQDRKISRNSTKVVLAHQKQNRNERIRDFFGQTHNDSLDDLVKVMAAPLPSYRSMSISQSDSDDFVIESLGDGNTSSDSDYTTPPPPATLNTATPPISNSSTIKIKLSMAKSDSSSAHSPEKLSKHRGNLKKSMISARERKAMAKVAQKLAAKERKQAGGKPTKHGQQEETQAVATTAMKTLYI